MCFNFLSVLRPSHPRPLGDHPLGSIRMRLPTAPGSSRPGLYAQVHYPANLNSKIPDVGPFPWFRPEVINEIGEGYGIPKCVLQSLLGNQRQLDLSYAPRKADGQGWPIVLFTSGIWGCCEMYTQLCREMASAGMIVIAVEHEDGSGIYAINGVTGKPVPYVKVPDGADVGKFRQPFLERHVEDIGESAAAIIATALDVGNHRPETDLISMVLRYGDPKKMIIMGHSFGSTGVVRYLSRLAEHSEPSPFCGAILMDIWTEPLLEADVARKLPVPFAILFSGQWKASSKFNRLVKVGNDHCLAVGRVLKTAHQWVSESHLFGPAMLLRKIGIMGKAHYRRAHVNTIHFARCAAQHFLTLEGPFGSFDALDQETLQVWPASFQSKL